MNTTKNPTDAFPLKDKEESMINVRDKHCWVSQQWRTKFQWHANFIAMIGICIFAAPSSTMAEASEIPTVTQIAIQHVAATKTSSKQTYSKQAKLVGIDVIEKRLGAKAPTGRGVTMGHIESGGPMGGQYMPNIHNHRYAGVRFKLMSQASKVSGHADATARLVYGKQGLAPGVTDVHLYEARDWMMDRGLNIQRVLNRERTLWSPVKPPTSRGRRVLTNSWIHTSSAARDTIALRRLDYLIDRENVIVVAGVNNGGATSVPHLLASSYNAIAVGIVGKKSSSGYTRIEMAGRCKPDVVVDMSKTSFSTPVAAAVVARLVETADRIVDVAVDKHAKDKTKLKRKGKVVVGAIGKSPALHANKAQVIKAVLMVGADKSCGYSPEVGRSLDQHHGAGAVRFDRSYDILTAGSVLHDRSRAAGAGAVALMRIAPPLKQVNGWSFGAIGINEVQTYTLRIDQPAKELCIAVVWHRQVKGHVVDHPGEPSDKRDLPSKGKISSKDKFSGKDRSSGKERSSGVDIFCDKPATPARRMWRTAVHVADLNVGLIRVREVDEVGVREQPDGQAGKQVGQADKTGETPQAAKVGLVEIMGKSMSKVDNVEHIYLRDVVPGVYQIIVRRTDARSRADTPYALAWWRE